MSNSTETQSLELPNCNNNPNNSKLTQPSTTGRFTILNQFAKDNSDSDFESPQPTPTRPVKTFAQRTLYTRFSQSVDSRSLPSKATASSTVSRFRIVPLESKYKRGRWQCYDYYDKKESSASTKPRIPEPATLQRAIPNRDRSVRSLTSETLQQSTVPVRAPILYDGSSESDRENNDVFARSTPTFSRTITVQPRANSVCPTNTASTLNNKKEQSRPTRKPPSEKLQKGLETSLVPTNTPNPTNTKRADLLNNVSVVSGSSNGTGQTPTLPIDSKIEQAMDLVKTHLMIAVREELDLLRARIIEFETHVHRLEAENSVLKANIPDEILKKLGLEQFK